MKYLDEYRDEKIARGIVAELGRRATRPWVLMEICGGQTHTLMRYGIDEILPAGIELVHGPGCPVCVTSLETIDKAIEIASRPDVTLISYGDMLRVPGSRTDLFHVKAQGGDVRVVYSPTEALKFARANPARKVVFFAVGFETTAPANAMAVWQAKREGLGNFSMLASHVLVPPAIRALLGRSAGIPRWRVMQAHGWVPKPRPRPQHRPGEVRAERSGARPARFAATRPSTSGRCGTSTSTTARSRCSPPPGPWLHPIALGILDDHSRLCCHVQWYLSETAVDLVHGLSQAIQKRGLPRALLTDNGSAMVAEEVTEGCCAWGSSTSGRCPTAPTRTASKRRSGARSRDGC